MTDKEFENSSANISDIIFEHAMPEFRQELIKSNKVHAAYRRGIRWWAMATI